MKTGRVLQEERLHVGNLKNSFIVTGCIRIPGKCPALFDCLLYGVYIDDVVADFRHQHSQDAFIDTREALRIHQILCRQPAEPVGKPCFFLYVPGYLVELPAILAVKPVGYQIITIRLMRHRKEGIQPCQIVLVYGSGGCSQQKMNRQPSKVRFLTFVVAGCPCHHGPERILCAVGYKALVNAVLLYIQSGANDRTDDAAQLGIGNAAKRCHDSKMHLGSRADVDVQPGHCVTPRLGIEELPVMLHLLADNLSRRQAHLIHPDGIQVSPELLAVQLHIEKPVVVIALKRTGIVNKEVVMGSFLAEQLLYRKGVIPGQGNHLGMIQLQLG